ncbi:bifunctional DNA-formamidopyrimidine glycosylase/DNA-(apurinic or apyrimidinic site) lyase [Candidatus Saccharibacteria bacterium]|nr:bifunctional DNA-formamidopyrimidine glycosylase/DNA-(apurinic or apyrimidinic site) lyase [Candidatus Saccharibacteria bacterium]
MPELPEVETIKRGLSNLIIKQKIKKAKVLCEKSFVGKIEEIKSATIENLRRFGKAIVIDLNNGKSLMIHLRMTGQLIYDGKERYAAGHPSDNFLDNLPNKQTRVILELENGTLYFNDQRKFGFIKVLETKEVENDPFIKKLAKEPWDITPEEFYQKLQKHQNSPIKATILDQTIIAGLGNIYADETLFMSKIHPTTKSGQITKNQAKTIIENAKKVMEKSIDSGGSTLKDYKKADGTKGDYLDKFAQVFNKKGQPCPVCKTPIKKIKVAGRGTHICPHCQKEKK